MEEIMGRLGPPSPLLSASPADGKKGCTPVLHTGLKPPVMGPRRVIIMSATWRPSEISHSGIRALASPKVIKTSVVAEFSPLLVAE